MDKTAVILQSNYIPWMGYFDLISASDLFLFYDVVQYTKNDWRNRNRIKGPNGVFWLTIPTGSNNSKRINEINVSDNRWKKKHLASIRQSYRKSSHFSEIESLLENIYSDPETNLSKINQSAIKKISSFLHLDASFHNIENVDMDLDPTLRLITVLKSHGVTRYLSGPSAKNYLAEEQFFNHGVELEYFDYKGYEPYPQLHGPFNSNLSIIDLLANCGLDGRRYLKNC